VAAFVVHQPALPCSLANVLLFNNSHLLTLTAEARATCTLAHPTTHLLTLAVEVGITTDEIDRQVHEFIVRSGAYVPPLPPLPVCKQRRGCGQCVRTLVISCVRPCGSTSVCCVKSDDAVVDSVSDHVFKLALIIFFDTYL
jgi:hypothetical protein